MIAKTKREVSHLAHRLGNRTPGGSNYPPSPFSRINFFSDRWNRAPRSTPFRHILEDSRLIWQPSFAKIPPWLGRDGRPWIGYWIKQSPWETSHGPRRPSSQMNDRARYRRDSIEGRWENNLPPLWHTECERARSWMSLLGLNGAIKLVYRVFSPYRKIFEINSLWNTRTIFFCAIVQGEILHITKIVYI